MWNKREVNYEGTSKVKETHINMLVHDYKLFQMKEGESIEEMFARFSKIISDLKAFEKGHLKKKTHEEKKKKVAFKATTDMIENDIDDNPEALEEEIAMVSINMDGLMRRYKNKKRGRISSRQTRQYNEQDKNDGKCYEYGRYRHVQAECPDLKRKAAGQMKEFQMTNARMKMKTVLWHEDILDLTLKESQKLMNELKRFNMEKIDWKLMLEVCESEKEVLQEEFQELQMQLNGMCKSTSHSSVKSNQVTYKSTKKGPTRTESTSTSGRSKNGSPSEHHRKSRKGKWYLDSACSSHTIGDKNLFKEVTKINGGRVKFGDDSKGKIVGTGTVPFNNNSDIIEVYLVDGLNYNLLSISQMCDSGYEEKFKKIGCAIEDELGKIILPGKRYGNVYIIDGFENIDGHICLTSMSDDPWLWHKKLGHASMHLIDILSKHDLVIGEQSI
ncbi:uncharacterized protein [Nicotiana tomentosiformis]|uniref:uncharacterized protein n=1 Tax=Nicotiana tomentosiformis TaxID=4098 RepID=UPI00388CBF69